jgi:hypothetical protein
VSVDVSTGFEHVRYHQHAAGTSMNVLIQSLIQLQQEAFVQNTHCIQGASVVAGADLPENIKPPTSVKHRKRPTTLTDSSHATVPQRDGHHDGDGNTQVPQLPAQSRQPVRSIVVLFQYQPSLPREHGVHQVGQGTHAVQNTDSVLGLEKELAGQYAHIVVGEVFFLQNIPKTPTDQQQPSFSQTLMLLQSYYLRKYERAAQVLFTQAICKSLKGLPLLVECVGAGNVIVVGWIEVTLYSCRAARNHVTE